MDYKEVFDKFEDQNIFIKTTQKVPMPADQKAALNRKGNELYTKGDIEGAKRIFLATGYSDGISRIGDAYKKQKRYMDALYMYQIAPDQRKIEAMAKQISVIIKNLIKEN